jgi:peptidoglycan/LPS O-acetylase OafA/YrhL
LGERAQESTYRVDLDGLRGLVIDLVLGEHAGVGSAGGSQSLPFSPALAGVTTFFVLSGYLITRLLASVERIDLRNFYLRRVIRPGPERLVLITVISLVGLSSGGLIHGWPVPLARSFTPRIGCRSRASISVFWATPGLSPRNSSMRFGRSSW